MSEKCKAKCGREGAVKIKYGQGKVAHVCYECHDKATKESKWEFLTDDERPVTPPATPTS